MIDLLRRVFPLEAVCFLKALGIYVGAKSKVYLLRLLVSGVSVGSLDISRVVHNPFRATLVPTGRVGVPLFSVVEIESTIERGGVRKLIAIPLSLHINELAVLDAIRILRVVLRVVVVG